MSAGMRRFDTLVLGGTVVTATDAVSCDIAIQGGRIAALGHDLGEADTCIDATGRLVLPGGVEGHCHVEQYTAFGMMNADDFHSATVSAAFGGTTTILPFAAQHRGQSLMQVVRDYHERAAPKAVIDYGFHVIVSDPSGTALTEDLPALIAQGLTSFKVFLTYERLMLRDRQVLDVLQVARRHGAMVMVHAENNDMIGWLTDRLVEGGHEHPRYHAVAHPRIAEGEATHRAIALAELMDVPILIVHVSSPQAMDEIRRAQTAGLKVYAETCPQYLFLTADDLDRAGMEGAKFCCSPPPRDKAAQERIWTGLRNGTFQVFSSDHSPFRFDATGKLHAGPNPAFHQIANGIPGIELRMPLLFSEGVNKGRIDLHQFVALTATGPARTYGLHPRKGSIAVGADADLAIWDPNEERVVEAGMLHDNAGYTPYEGMRIKGWPIQVLSRGRLVVDRGELRAERGSGRFIARACPEAARPLGRRVPELDPATNFGAVLLDEPLAGKGAPGTFGRPA